MGTKAKNELLVVCVFCGLLLLLTALDSRADYISFYNVKPGDTVVATTTQGDVTRHKSPSNTYVVTGLAATWGTTLSVSSPTDLYTKLATVIRRTEGSGDSVQFYRFTGNVPSSWPSNITFIQDDWWCVSLEEAVASGQTATSVNDQVLASKLSAVQSQVSSSRLSVSGVQNAVFDLASSVKSSNAGILQNVSSARSAADRVGVAAKQTNSNLWFGIGAGLVSILAMVWRG